jgi:hypothetical protein
MTTKKNVPAEQPQALVLLTKADVARLLQCCTRQVELLVQKGRIAKPIYLGEGSPRWHRDELMESISAGARS